MTHQKLSLDHEVKMSRLDRYDALVLARRDFLQRWLEWAESRPPAADITSELDATVGAVWGIAATVSAAPPRADIFEKRVAPGGGGVHV